PFLGVRRHREARRDRLYTWDEWTTIYSKAGPRLQVIMDMLFLTDQRIGDVLKIDLRDLLDEGIYVKQQKTGKELIVAWNDELHETVDRAKRLYGSVIPVRFRDKRSQPLLRNRHGKSPDYRTVALQWRTACTAAGVEDAHLHDGRAFSATEAQRQGLDAQKILGHEDARTTKIYLRGREVEVVRGPQMRRILGA
ncbi:MAG TPA: tyrosine-type recombinase/integrase, partial [Burkholderiales bacterium]|nr:tyrosine-type recombinase/integrase [Burkholderiales bacterium]